MCALLINSQFPVIHKYLFQFADFLILLKNLLNHAVFYGVTYHISISTIISANQK